MNLSYPILRQRVILFLIFAFIAIVLLSPLAADNTVPNLSDFFNHIIAIMQAKMALAEGQFPLRVAPLEQSGWRYPLYQFYASSSYTLAGLLYRWITPTNPYTAYKLTLWCALVLGGLYMYRLAYWFVRSKPAAILAGVVYLCSPYNIILINHLGAFNEVIALGILPAVLYYTLQRYYHPYKMKTLLQVSLAWYLLATIHIITFVYAAFFTAIWLLLITAKSHKHWKNLIYVGTGFGFGCLLAMWSLGPIFILQHYLIVHGSTHVISPFNAVSPPLLRLLSPVAQLNVLIVNGQDTYTTTAQPTIGWPILMAAGICLCGFFYRPLAGNKRSNYLLASLLILFFIVFFMIWSPINFWQWLPESFRMVQLTSRLSGQLTWIGALLFAWAICWLFQNKLDIRHIVLGIVLIVVTTSVWLPISEIKYVKLSDIIKNPVTRLYVNAYLIDAIEFPYFIDKVDSLDLNQPNQVTDKNFNGLKFDLPGFIPVSLLKSGKLFISLQGSVPNDNKVANQQFNIVVNNSIVATPTLKPGAFDLHIPLMALHDFFKNKSSLSLQIKSSHPDVLKQSKVDISLNKIILSGFLKSADTMNVNQVQPHCQQRKEDTVCHVDVPAGTQLVELPALYYPDMLHITNNGKPAPYYSIYYQGRLLAGIAPEAGKINDIVIQFIGLMWANYISSVMWYLWIFFVVYLVLQKMLKPTFGTITLFKKR